MGKGLLRQGTARYWLAHDDYVFAMRECNIEWQQWKLEAQSFGLEFRDSWPPTPMAPLQPAEMLKLDMPPLRDKVEHAKDREGRPSVLISNGAAPMTSLLPVVLSWSCGRACGLMYRGVPENCPDSSPTVPLH